jgi:hypothetical protein
MLHVSTQKLIIKLCELTAAGGIAWKDGAGQSTVFETEGYLVEIQERPPTVRLLQPDGRELERADEAELAAQPWPDGNSMFAAHVADMAAHARRIARGTDLAISRILSSLSAPPRRPTESGPPLVALEFEQESSGAPGDQSPPPAPHSMPAPLPEPVGTDTAIDRVLAIQPISPPPAEPPSPEPLGMESESTVSLEPEAVPEAKAEEAPASEPDSSGPVSEAEEEAEAPDPVRESAPQFVPPSIARQPAPRAHSAFGATPSFARKREPIHTKITSTGLALTGFVPAAHQPRRSEPDQPPVPAAPRPVPPEASVPAADRKREPAIAGPDIYKPWT